MVKQTPFEQNVIALIWNFDKTLARDYMQTPIFKKYNVDQKEFWNETNSLVEKYREMGIKVNPDTVYLNHFLTCVEQGIFPGLNNALLRELGKEIEFFDGIPHFFNRVKEMIENDNKYQKYNIKVEHYVVSTGLAEMIKGSAIDKFVDGIWGCEFIEEPIKSKLDNNDSQTETTPGETPTITQVAYAIDNTSKTRALFEINKGVNIYEEFDVNAKMDEKNRRIPFSNMIYIADGPSDVPAFSIVKQRGGRTFAVYPPGKADHMKQVDKLRKDGRIDMYGEANYKEGTQTYLWLTMHIKEIADRIYQEKEDRLKSIVNEVPGHILE